MTTTKTIRVGLGVFGVLAVCVLAFVAALVMQPATQAHADNSKLMYRLYNPNSGEHFYTSSVEERNHLVKVGWKRETDAWLAPTQGDPVYRLYNPNAGEHHYSMSSVERDSLVRNGWKYEGIGWYSDPAANEALYCLYNPNAFANNHHYTTSTYERDQLVKKGWKYEEIKWYGVPKGGYYADINIKDYGTIRISLNAEAAPKTTENFVKLAKKGFYNGTGFHRIIKDFMMQGGSPDGTSTGGSGESIYGEFKDHGWDNPLSHTRGTLSLARATDYNSGSSQFFICHKDVVDLDGHYAAFGRVMSGMDIVDKICDNAKPIDDNGSIAKADRPIVSSIKIGTF